jgi:hypothetical protein
VSEMAQIELKSGRVYAPASRVLEGEARRRRKGTDRYQALSEALHSAREETAQEVRGRKEAEAEVNGLYQAIAERDERCAARAYTRPLFSST